MSDSQLTITPTSQNWQYGYDAATHETKKCKCLLAFLFIILFLVVGFLLVNNNNCQCQLQLDMINERMEAHNLHVDNAIHLLEYQIKQLKEMLNINIKNLETEMYLLAKTKYTIKYNAYL
jgi:hypothetical protein